jgi:hypothetical protein
MATKIATIRPASLLWYSQKSTVAILPESCKNFQLLPVMTAP